MKEDKVIPLEEIVFAKYMGELSRNFKLDNNSRLPFEVRHSPLFKGFRDGYLDFQHKYQNMPNWKQGIIQFFIGVDHITAYELYYYWGQACRKNRSLPYQFEEVVRV